VDPNIDDFLSALEIGCVALSIINENTDPCGRRGAAQTADEAIREINQRFEQHAVGYQFENGEIITMDSKLAHAEIIKPALNLLAAPVFAKANEDFMTAHRQFRAGEF
jgi:hypothetical protein